ncbi:MAG: D-alanyl-D-alanine carboxypeptidase [Oscillospiraceae bacterium]|nr:D-alanyl-D-alanine carboxypeptidase [Oscillospiraceae bacterium]
MTGKRKISRGAYVVLALTLAAAASGGTILWHMSQKAREQREQERLAAMTTSAPVTEAETTAATTTTTVTLYPAAPVPDADSLQIADTELVKCRNFVLAAVNEGDDTVLYERGSQERTYPASITKVMSLLTFYEICPPDLLNGTMTMTDEIRTIAISQRAMCAGFVDGEVCRITDLIYGMMLPSGADAALALAFYACGSEEAFVEQMNLLAQKMGLRNTHFTNCTGLHDENHYSTAADIEAMMAYAISDARCAEVLSTARYQTSGNTKHENGIILKSTVLSRISGDELIQINIPVTVIGGKTGFTDEAGQCLATWAQDKSGKQYICVILGCDKHNAYDAVCDTLTLYELTQNPPQPVERYLYAWMTTTETTTTTTETTTMTTTVLMGNTVPTMPAWTSVSTNIAAFSTTTTTTTAAPAHGG